MAEGKSFSKAKVKTVSTFQKSVITLGAEQASSLSHSEGGF